MKTKTKAIGLGATAAVLIGVGALLPDEKSSEVPVVVETTHPAPPSLSPPAEVYYADCDAVRAAGASPLHAGQPGYRSGLDRDGDGVACE